MVDTVKNGEEKVEEVGAGLFTDDAAKTAEEKAGAEKAAADKAAAEAKVAADAKAKTDADAKAKSEAENKGKKVVPDKYELKLPEGSNLSAFHVEKIASLAKERGLSQEEAQSQLDLASQIHADFRTSQDKEFEVTKTGWLEQLKTDKRVGGENLKANDEKATRVIKHFAPSEEASEKIIKTGMLMEPDVFRLVVNIANAMSDDQFVKPGSQTTETQDIAKKFYGDSNKKE